jgi:hemin uptake protein HemP
MAAINMTEPPVTPESPSLPIPNTAGAPPPASSRESWRSDELLGDRTEVLIIHGSEVYRLRRTRQDKLILYK